jgi:hypothetical protein
MHPIAWALLEMEIVVFIMPLIQMLQALHSAIKRHYAGTILFSRVGVRETATEGVLRLKTRPRTTVALAVTSNQAVPSPWRRTHWNSSSGQHTCPDTPQKCMSWSAMCRVQWQWPATTAPPVGLLSSNCSPACSAHQQVLFGAGAARLSQHEASPGLE